jgi:hypothetical protein
MRVTTSSLTFDRQLSLALTHSSTLTRFKLLRELTRVFAPLTSNIQIITLYHQLSYTYRRTGLMLSRGAVESLPELLWSWIVMKLPAFN